MNTRLFPPLLFLLTTALSFAPITAAWAERADRNKPMNIEADALRHDEARQTSVFSGRVVLTKGTIVLRGARLEVRQDADGFQYGTMTAGPGERAFFRQKRDTPPGAAEEFLEGQGERIEYDSRADTMRLVQRAELRRLRQEVPTDELAGALIVYNNRTDVFTVDGNHATAASEATGRSGRIRAVLSPKEPLAVANEEVGAPPPLRSSTAVQLPDTVAQ